MPVSRERAVDLSHRTLDRLAKTPGVELTKEREVVRNQVVRAILDFDKELERLTAEARQRVAGRGRRVAEGSREWDLLVGEELERALATLLARGE